MCLVQSSQAAHPCQQSFRLQSHSKPVSKKNATSAHFRFRLILHFAIRPYQGVTCQEVVRWVNGKFSYERPGTLGSPLGYVLLDPPRSFQITHNLKIASLGQ